VSDFPTNPNATGYPTRIIAGKIRAAAIGSTPDQGVYLPNGSISLLINGALIDAVLAASVAPFGNNGTLPTSPPPYGTVPVTSISASPPPSPSNYQAPAGLTNNTTPNYSIRNVVNGAYTKLQAWQSGDLHDTVLSNGTITATITGGVVSTQVSQTGDTYDYAGLFAYYPFGVTPPQERIEFTHGVTHDAPGQVRPLTRNRADGRRSSCRNL